MPTAAICFDTCHGHTQKIARSVAMQMQNRGMDVTLRSVRSDDSPSFSQLDAVIVLAPIHTGHHSRHLRRFIQDHKVALACIPTMFLSVSLSAAGDPAQQDDAIRVMEEFLDETKWRPTMQHIVEGELAYRRYTWLTRLLMRIIAWRAGGNTDTRKNHVYTDWERLERHVDDFVDALAGTDSKVQPDAAPTGPRSLDRVAS